MKDNDRVTLVDGTEVTHKILNGFNTWEWTNPRTGDRLRLRYALRDRLELYIQHGNKEYVTRGDTEDGYYLSVVPPIMCGDHPQEVAHAWITRKLAEYWQGVGREAYANGEHAAPSLNVRVRACLDVPVGTPGTLDIMRWFSEGWTAANLAAEVPEESAD